MVYEDEDLWLPESFVYMWPAFLTASSPLQITPNISAWFPRDIQSPWSLGTSQCSQEPRDSDGSQRWANLLDPSHAPVDFSIDPMIVSVAKTRRKGAR